MKETEKKIIEIIDTLRPYLINDGGDIEFIKYENNIVYIKMMGACADCMMIDFTLKDGIEFAIKEEVPEVLEVRNISEGFEDLEIKNVEE
jgi:Fe-S cluster biogenesis protein NfuA